MTDLNRGDTTRPGNALDQMLSKFHIHKPRNIWNASCLKMGAYINVLNLTTEVDAQCEHNHMDNKCTDLKRSIL